MPTNLVRSVVDVASGDDVDFKLDVVPQTSDFVSNVTATLNFTLNGATTNVPFAFAGATSTNLDGDATAEIAAADLKAAMSDLTGIANRPFLTGDVVEYYATVNYFADNADTDESKLYENRYFPDNHKTVMVGDVEHWVVEGTGDDPYTYVATNFTVTGPALSVVGTPVVTATGVKFLVHGYSEDTITNITVNVGGVDYTLYGGDATNRVTKMFEIDSGLTADTEYAVTISGLKADGTELTPAKTSFMTFTAAIAGVDTNKVELTVSGPAAGYVLPDEWVKSGAKTWTRTGGTPNSAVTATVTATNAAGAASVQTVTGYTKAAAATWKPDILKNGNQVVVKAYADHTDDGNPADTEYAIGIATNDVYSGIATKKVKGVDTPVWKSLADWQTSETFGVPAINLDTTNTFFFVTRNTDLLETRSDLSTNCWFDLAVRFEGTPAQATKPFNAGLEFGNVAVTNVYFDPSFRQGAKGIVEVAICKDGDTLPTEWTTISEADISFAQDVMTVTNAFVWDAWKLVQQKFDGARTNYTYRLRATVKAGNRVSDPAIMPEESASSCKLDFALPVVTIDGTPADKSATSNRVVSLTASVAAVDQDGATYYWTFNTVAQPEGATLSKVSEKEGENTASVYAYDKFGNQSAAVTRTWTLDTEAPTDFKVEGMPETTDPLTVTNRTEAFHLSASAKDATSGGVTYHWNTNGADVVGAYGPNYDFSAVEGTNTVVAYALDAVSNQTAWVTNTWVVDTYAPTNLVITGLPPALTHATNLNLSATAMDATRLQFHWKLDTADWVVGESFEKDRVADGTHTISVYATDEAQNPSVTSNYTWTIDTTIPDMPAFTSGSPAKSCATNDTAYSFTVGEVTDVTEVTYHWQLTKDGALCGSEIAKTKDEGGLTFAGNVAVEESACHVYTTMVWAVDAAMNVSTTNFWGWTYDTTPPGDPQFDETSSPSFDSVTSVSNYNLKASSTDADAYYWTLSLNGTSIKTGTGATFKGDVAVDGVYTAMVYTVDKAGNFSLTTNSWAWIFDKTSPDLGDIEGVTPEYDCETNSPAYELSASSDDANPGTNFWALVKDGATVASLVLPATNNVPTVFKGEVDAGDGVYTAMVWSVDAAGNASTATNRWIWTYDTTPPGDPQFDETSSPAFDSVTSVSNYNLKASSTDADAYYWTLSLNGTSIKTGTGATFKGDVAVDGVYTAMVYTVDKAGNFSMTTNSWAWIFDKTSPIVSDIEGVTPEYGCETNSPAYELSASSDDVNPGTNFWALVKDGATVASLALPATNNVPTVFKGEVNAGDGVYTAMVWSVDAAGNVSATNFWGWTYDTVEPSMPAFDPAKCIPADGAVTNGTPTKMSYSLTAESDEKSGLTYYWALLKSDGTFQRIFRPNSGAYTGMVSVEGVYTAMVYSVDRAGNISATNSWCMIYDRTPPTIAAITGTPENNCETNIAEYVLSASSDDLHPGTNFWALVKDGATVSSLALPATNNVATVFKGEVNAGDGVYTAMVWSVDAAGNVSATNFWGWTYDTTPPGDPQFDETSSPAFDSVTSVSNYNLKASSTDADAYYWTLILNGTSIKTGTGATFKGDVAVDGVYTAMVYTVDKAGNFSLTTNSWAWIFDKTLPIVSDIEGVTPEYGCETNSPAYELSASSDDANPGTNFWALVKDGATVASLVLPATNNVATVFKGEVNAGDGVYTAMVWSVDAAGNVSATNFWGWTYDTTPPGDPQFDETSSPAFDSVTSVSNYNLKASSTDADAYYWTLSLNGTSIKTGTGATFKGDVAVDGVYTAMVYTVDKAGNFSLTTNSWAWIFDKTLPIVSDIEGVTPEYGCETNSPAYELSASSDDANPGTNFWALVKDGATVASLALPATNNVATVFKGEVNAGDGVYTAMVWSVDAAGNASTATNFWNWTYDTVKPVLDSEFGGTPTDLSITNDATYNLSMGSTKSVTHYWALVTNNMQFVEAWTAGGSKFKGTVEADGVYTAMVYTVDVAGNVSATNTMSWTYDKTPPQNLVIEDWLENGKVTRNKNFALYASATDATACQFYWALNGQWVKEPGDVFMDKVTADGVYTASVYAVDAALNVSVTNDWVWSVDTTSPIVSDINGITPESGCETNSPAYELSASSDDKNPGTNFWALVKDGATVASLALPATNNVATVFKGEVNAGDGVYTAMVWSVDAAGNASTATNRWIWTYDTTPNAVPEFDETVSTPAAGTVTNGAWYSLSATSSDAKPGTTYHWALVTNNMQFVRGWEVVDGKFEATVPVEGVYTALVYSVDRAGNISETNEWAWVYDATAPQMPDFRTELCTPAKDSATNVTDNTFAIYEITNDATTVTYYWQLTSDGDVTDQWSGTDSKALEFSGDMDEDKNRVHSCTTLVWAVDAAGNVSATNFWNWTYDTVAPAEPTLSAESYPQGGVTNALTYAFSATTDKSGSSYHWVIYDSDGAVITNDVCDLFTGAIEVDGVYTAKVYVVDRAGNFSTTNAWSWLVDTVRPTVKLSSDTPDPFQEEHTFKVTVAFSEKVYGFETNLVTVDNGVATSKTEVAEGVYEVLIAPITWGRMTVSIAADVVRDVAGNGNEASEPLTRVYGAYPIPTLTTDAPEVFEDSPTFRVNVKFTMPVDWQSVDMFSVSNGTIGKLSVADDSGWFDVKASKEGEVRVWIASNVVYSTIEPYFGNFASEVLVRTYDKTAPKKPVVSGYPQNGSVTNVSEYVLASDAADVSTVTNYWTLNGQTYTTANGEPLAGDVVVDGVYTAEVYAVDAIGHVSETNRVVWTVKRPPAKPEVVGEPMGGVTTNRIFYSYTASTTATNAPAVLHWLLAKGEKSIAEADDCEFFAGEVPEKGEYTVSVYATDANGNSSETNVWSWLCTGVKPSMPEADAGSIPAAGSVTNGSGYAFSATSVGTADMTYYWTLLTNNCEVVTNAACGKFFGDVPVEGVYTVLVYAVDAVGGVSATNVWSWTYDKTAPADLTLAGAPLSPDAENLILTNLTTFSFTASAADATAITYTWAINGVVAPGQTSATFSGSAVEGTNTVSVFATDAAGNACAPIVNKWVVDSSKLTAALASETVDPMLEGTNLVVDIAFNKPVSLTRDKLTVVNGTIVDFTGEGADYAVTVQPMAIGQSVSVSIAANAVVDAAGNGNEASAILTRFYGDGPVATLSANVKSPFTNKTFIVTVEFDKDVTGWADKTLSVSNGAAKLLMNTDNIGKYTVTVADSLVQALGGQIAILVPAGAVKAKASPNYPNVASETLVLTYGTEVGPVVPFGGGVTFPVIVTDPATGKSVSNEVVFTTADFTPTVGDSCKFTLSGFKAASSGEISNLDLWFVVRETLAGESRYAKVADKAVYVDGKPTGQLTVTLPADAMKKGGDPTGERCSEFFIMGIDSKAK